MNKLIPGKLYRVKATDSFINHINVYGITVESPIKIFSNDIFTFLYTKEMCRFGGPARMHYFILFGNKICTFCYYAEPNKKFEDITTQVL